MHYIIMPCIPKTSSRMEMITMDVSKSQNSNEDNNTFQITDIEVDNSEENISSYNTLSNKNIDLNVFSSLYEKIKDYLYSFKIIVFDNFNTIYGNFLHIYFIIVFEILFYFNYVINIEYEEIKRVLKSFSYDLNLYFGDIINNIPNHKNDVFEKMCQDLNVEYLYKNNEILKQKAYNIIWILSICLTVIIIMHYLIVKNLKKLAYKSMEAFVFISCIAMFEYYFFTEIITKYNVMTSPEASCILYENMLN